MAFTLSKQGDAYEGAQCLRIACDANCSGAALQDVTTVDHVMRVQGVARSDGTRIPKVYDGSTLIWSGTNSTNWQEISETYTATDTQPLLCCTTDSASGYVEFDDIAFVDLTEACSDYTSGNDAILSKRNDTLRVEYNGTNDPYAEQLILSIGTEYNIIGQARGNGVAKPIMTDGVNTLWTGTVSSSWQDILMKFEADGAQIRFCADTVIPSYVEFRNMLITNEDTDLSSFYDLLIEDDLTNECSPHGRTLKFEGAGFLSSDREPIIPSYCHTLALVYYPVGAGGIVVDHVGANSTIECEATADKMSYSIYDGSDYHTVEADILTDEWNRYVFTVRFDGVYTVVRIYHNGALEDTKTFRGEPSPFSAEPLLIGTDGSSHMSGKLSYGLWVKSLPWVESFDAEIVSRTNSLSDAMAYSSLTEIDGGHYTGLDGIPLDDSVADSIYRIYCLAKVFSTYTAPTISGIYQFIVNTFDKEAKVNCKNRSLDLSVSYYETMLPCRRECA